MTARGAIEKYLEHYSVDDRWKIAAESLDGIDNVVVIPALAESDHIFKTLSSLSENPPSELSRTLVVVVINNGSADIVSPDNFADNQYTLKVLSNREPWPVVYDDVRQNGLRVAYVDASSHGFELPDKTAGVGYARKIGMDLALEVFDHGKEFPKLLFCLDSDTLVERNYLEAVRDSFEKGTFASSVIAFAHQDAESVDEQAAICCYEIFLRYYVLALRWAGSPYAFHSIGSTMACTATAYAGVRGMNKRKAGEDFYFLDKLAKTGRMGRINTTTVYPASRRSARVPFGTGKRIISFTENNEKYYTLYNLETFSVLKKWLAYITSAPDTDPEIVLAQAKRIHPSLDMFLRMNHFDRTWSRLVENSGDIVHLRDHVSRWFDGFKTFKLIRYLTNNGLHPASMFDALKEVMDMMGKELPVRVEPGSVPPIRDMMHILDRLREIDR